MNTKTILFTLLLAFAGMSVQAQIVTSRSRLVTKIKKPPFEKTLYLAAGGLLNTRTDPHYSVNPGYEAVLGYQQGFKRNKKFGSQWGVEAGITTHGYKLEQHFYSYDESPLCLTVSPFTYAYRIGVGANKSFWIEPHIGVEANIRLDDDDSDKREYTNSYSREPHYSATINGDGFDVGIRLGLRMWVARRISLDVACRVGVVGRSHDLELSTYTYESYWQNHYTRENMKGNNASLLVRLGVKLNK